MAGADNTSGNSEATRRLVLFAVAALGVSCVMTQLALMRELLGAFSGNEMVLGIVLGLWLLLMGLGTCLGRTADRLQNPLTALLTAQIFIAVIPLAQVFAVRALRNVAFVRGAEVGVNGTVLSAAGVLLPYCILAGYALTLACSILNRAGDASSAGRVYVADSLGSIAGGVLFSFVLVRWLDHIALLVVPAVLNLTAAACLGSARRRSAGFNSITKSLRWEVFILTPAAGILALVWFVDPDAYSTALQFPGQQVVSRENSPYGKVIVAESDDQFNFIENGVPFISSHNVQQVEETVHYAMAQRPDARRVLLVSGGISGTAKEILKYDTSTVDYVELDPLILKLGQKYLPENLADSRIRIINTDGRLFIKQTGDRYDVVILDVPDPSTAQLNRFYTAEFFAEVKRVLARDGVLSFALGHYENFASQELAQVLASAHRTVAQSFSNALVIPGGRVFFLASDGSLHSDIAARIAQRQLKTHLVNRHYLDAMLTPDRMADIQRATVQSAAVNKDFSPVLYYYHLRHWMSQFQASFGVLHGVLLILLCWYLARLRGPALVLFASGFAGSALEMVLLLAFQVLCGSVYHQVGVIVTLFMAGLALGAFVVNRSSRRKEAPIEKSQIKDQKSKIDQSLLPSAAAKAMDSGGKHLAILAFAIAGYAVLLPLLLPQLNRMGGSAISLFVVKTVIGALTLILAMLAGMQFPLANRLEYDGGVSGASRLYTADFVGAFVGALLASTLLIPLIGVSGVCLATAGLNILGGFALQWRKAAA